MDRPTFKVLLAWVALGLFGVEAINNYENLIVTEEVKVLVDAVSSIVLDVSAKNQVTAYFTVESTYNSMDLMNKMFLKYLENTVKQVEDVKQAVEAPQFFNIFFVNSHRSFHNIYEGMTPKKFDYQGHFLIVMTERPRNYLDHLKQIFEDLWEILIVNVNIIVETKKGEAQLFTYFPYTKNYCAEVHPVLWKTFKNGTFKTNKKAFYPPKSKKLFDCPVKVVSFDCPLMTIEYKNDGNHIYTEIDGKILLMLADRINFKINLIPSKVLKWGSLFPNGTRTGAFKMVIDGEVDFAIGEFAITYLRNKFMTPSISYISSPWALMIPPGEPYSAFEKLFRPFDFNVWIAVTIIFILSYLVIAIISFSKQIKKYVIEKGNTSPYFDVLEIFVGGSMIKIPTRNFARVLLMIFILYSLVIRNAYQGGLLKNMQSDDRKRPVESVTEMMEKGFHFYMTATAASEHVAHLPIKDRAILVSSSEFSNYSEKLVNPFFKGSMAFTLDFIIHGNKQTYGNRTIEICKELLFTHQYVVYFRKNSYLVDSANRVIQDLQTNGMMSQWEKESMDPKYLKAPEPTKEPKRLDLSQLLGGLIIFVLGWVAGILFFFLELVSLKIKFVRSFINFITKSK